MKQKLYCLLTILVTLGVSLSVSAQNNGATDFDYSFKTVSNSLPISLEVGARESIVIYFSNIKGEGVNVRSWVDFIPDDSIIYNVSNHKVEFNLDSLHSNRYKYIPARMDHLADDLKKTYDDEIKKIIEEHGDFRRAEYHYTFSFSDSVNTLLRGGGVTSGNESVLNNVRDESIGSVVVKHEDQILRLEIPLIKNEPNSRILVILKGETALIVEKSMKENWNMTSSNCKWKLFKK